MSEQTFPVSPAVRRAIAVCALGYLVDAADVHLLAVLRVASLTDMGVPAARLAAVSGALLNAQMTGMLAGAFLWGWLGDRFGRLKVLYGSILVYSLGTLACGLARDPSVYGVLRFVTGFGLAGETGAAVTLVAELLPASRRGWGIAGVSAVGFLGPVLVTGLSGLLPWRVTYALMGATGLLILALRVGLVEPEMFRRARLDPAGPGALRLLAQPRQAAAFARCLLIGLPLIYAWSLLNFFSLELASAVLAPGEVFRQKYCLLAFYCGTSLGGVLGGVAAQRWGGRRRSIAVFLAAGAALSVGLLVVGPRWKLTAAQVYAVYGALGAAGGCWALFTAVAAEHFGTNVRATTSIVIANLVRGFTVPMILAFGALRARMSASHAAALVGLALYAVAFAALGGLRETSGADLDFVERLDGAAAAP